MKQVLILMLFILCSNEMKAQNDTCLQKMRTGTFEYEGMEGLVKIVRTKSKQTESVVGTDSKLILSVDWLNDSTYTLTHKKSVKFPGCLSKGDIIYTTILTCEGNKYSAKYTTKSAKDCGGGDGTFIKLE